MQEEQQETVTPYTTTVRLSGAAIDVLEQMFLHGPIWDGNVVSKQGRGELFDLKLAGRVEGWSFLTVTGMRMALDNKLDRKKEKWQRERVRRLNALDSIEGMFVSQTMTAVQPPPAAGDSEHIQARFEKHV